MISYLFVISFLFAFIQIYMNSSIISKFSACDSLIIKNVENTEKTQQKHTHKHTHTHPLKITKTFFSQKLY